MYILCHKYCCFLINSDRHNPTLSRCVCALGFCLHRQLALVDAYTELTSTKKKKTPDGSRAVLNYVILVRCQLYGRQIIFT